MISAWSVYQTAPFSIRKGLKKSRGVYGGGFGVTYGEMFRNLSVFSFVLLKNWPQQVI